MFKNNFQELWVGWQWRTFKSKQKGFSYFGELKCNIRLLGNLHSTSVLATWSDSLKTYLLSYHYHLCSVLHTRCLIYHFHPDTGASIAASHQKLPKYRGKNGGWSGVINIASYANCIKAELQSHYANEGFIEPLDKHSQLQPSSRDGWWACSPSLNWRAACF